MTDHRSQLQQSLVTHLRREMAPWCGAAAWVVALSGGCDSRLLLSLLAQWKREEPGLPALRAFHIDHGIHPDSGLWAAQCQQFCSSDGVTLTVKQVALQKAGDGLESMARRARYTAFESDLQDNELLLMAHHLDDQAETLMFRALRGAGPSGLAAMPQQRSLGLGDLFRPFLDVSRDVLCSVATHLGLSWIDDPANVDRRFDRNYLRHEVMPVIATRWPHYRQRLQAVATLQAEAVTLLDAYLDKDLDLLCCAQGGLDLAELETLDAAKQRALLRRFLSRSGVVVDRARVVELQRQCFSEQDRNPRLEVGAMSFRRFKQRLYAVPIGSEADHPQACSWHDLSEKLPWAGGTLSACAGGRFLPRGQVTVASRSEGLVCRPVGEPHRRSVKRIMQSRSVPPWLRHRLPLIFCDGELAAIANLIVCEDFAVDPGQGLTVRWDESAF